MLREPDSQHYIVKIYDGTSLIIQKEAVRTVNPQV